MSSICGLPTIATLIEPPLAPSPESESPPPQPTATTPATASTAATDPWRTQLLISFLSPRILAHLSSPSLVRGVIVV